MKNIEVSSEKEFPEGFTTISHFIVIFLLVYFIPEDIKFPATPIFHDIAYIIRQASAQIETEETKKIKPIAQEVKYDFPQFTRELTPDDIGRYVVIYLDTQVSDLPSTSKPRIILQIKKIGSMTLIQESVQIFEGGIVNFHIDGTYTVGESKMYFVKNIAYFLSNSDEITVNQGLQK